MDSSGDSACSGPADRSDTRAVRSVTEDLTGTSSRCIRIPPPELGGWYPDSTLIRIDVPTRLSQEGTNVAWVDGRRRPVCAPEASHMGADYWPESCQRALNCCRASVGEFHSVMDPTFALVNSWVR